MKRSHVIIIIVVVVAVLILAIGLGVGLNTTDGDTDESKGGKTDDLGYYLNGAVATDADQCSQIGRDMLKEGGHAVDAAIASLICTGVVNLHSTGIGGGGFMTVYDRKNKKAEIYDYRETGPASLTPDAYDENPDSQKNGGLAVGIPGELRGLHKVHGVFGKLSWKKLIQPSIDLARKGTIIGKHMARYIVSYDALIKADDGLKEILCIDEDCNTMKGVGEYIVNTKYADTLEEVSNNFDAINDGKFSAQIVDDIKSKNGNMTLEDLKNYTPIVRTPYTMKMKKLKLNLYTTPLPGGGAVLKNILTMIEGYNFTKEDESTLEKKILTYHRLAEIFKFSYSKRPYLGDPDKVTDNKTFFDQKVAEFLDPFNAEKLRLRINDSSTQEPSFYDPYFVTTEDHGTTHVSVIDKDGNAVSATDTINYAFGSKFRSPVNGIIYNNEMADYFTKRSYGSFFTNSSKTPLFNQPGPGRRPLSSTCPSIITDDNGDVIMVAGGSGGTRITLSTAWVMMKKLYMNYSLADAIEDPRVQHTFSPNRISNEKGKLLPDDIVAGLEKKNHIIKEYTSNAIIQGIWVDRSNGDTHIYAKSDSRKEGKAAGY